MSERQGIEIDYCPECRGVWLDRGELDKIIDRSTAESAPAERGEYTEKPFSPNHDHARENQSGHGSHGGYQDNYKKKKRGGLLGDLFDFGD
jgi:Zn-finger nucleic acid-binding protein